MMEVTEVWGGFGRRPECSVAASREEADAENEGRDGDMGSGGYWVDVS